MMVRVFLGLGSNKDREKNITAGLDALTQQFGPLHLSRVFESESVGFSGSHFYNMVVAVETDMPLSALSAHLKKIEDDNGRIRTGPKYSPRTLDIDILLYGDLVGNIDGIELPRDEILKNAFVLWPLAELAGDQCHPQLNITFAQLWADYPKDLQHLWPVNFTWR